MCFIMSKVYYSFPNKYAPTDASLLMYMFMYTVQSPPPPTTSFSLSILYILERKKNPKKFYCFIYFYFNKMIINHET